MSQSNFHIAFNSFRRCNESKNFYDIFYDNFFQSSDKIPVMFQNIDMDGQKKALSRGLFHLITFAKNEEAGAFFLDQIIEKHKNLNITSDLYDLWLNSLIAAIKKVDRVYNPDFVPVLETDKVAVNQVEEAWRESMKKGIDYLLKNQ